jgi:hypothetical protein
MSVFMGLNRRANTDRRTRHEQPELEQRRGDRRRYDTDRYVLVVGDSGVDRFGLIVGFPVALLVVAAVASTFFRI